jgi:TRAP transporter TAXI family solute receptor
MKKAKYVILCLAVLGCVSFDAWSAEKPKIYRLVIGTGGIAGSYYPLGGAMARIWTQNLPNIRVSAQATGASVENTKLMENGEVELGLTQNDLAEYAMKKQHMFDKEYKKLRAVATLFPEHIHLFLRQKANIKTIADLKGKRVSVGSQGSGGLANCQQIFELFGISFGDIKPFYLTNVDAVDRMKDGLLDAIFVTTSAPNAAFQEMAISTDITVFSFSDDEIKKIVGKYPFFQKAALTKDMYKGQTADAATVAVLAVLIASKDLDAQVVYDLTKTLWEKKDALAEMMVKAKAMDPKDPVKGITIPLHPGAERYYKETGKLK